MKLERSKNTVRNLFFGVITKIYNLIIPFLMRTAIIYLLGIEYVGLNSLFSSVLSVLNLAELGVGSALVFSMYKPLAEDDTEKICALMRLYKLYYRIIGLAVLILGLIVIPFLPYLVKGNLPDGMNLYILYLINLGTTVISYWLFAYKNCLLFLHQRNDISDKIGYVINTVKYLGQFLILYFLHDYYWFLIVAMLFGIVSNIITAIIVDKIYPQYKPVGKLSRNEINSINQKVKDLFTAKIGSIIVFSVDTLVISSFLGLKELALYQNYSFIANTVMGFITLITGAALAGIGNSIASETEQKNLKDLNIFSFVFFWLGTFSVCSLACLYQPFMELWVGKENLLPLGMVFLFCLFFIVQLFQNLLLTYKDAAGVWHQDRFRPLVTAGSNLIMNLIMVNFWGLYGILLSTIISILVIGMPWLLKNLFSTVFKSGLKEFVIKLLKYALVTGFVFVFCVFVCNFIDFDLLVLTLVVRAAICIFVPNIVLLLLYVKKPEFVSLLQIINSITNGKIGIISKIEKSLRGN